MALALPKKTRAFLVPTFYKRLSPIETFDGASEKDLNIYGMNNYPRYSFQFANTRLGQHKDEDNMVSININLMETVPIIHIEDNPTLMSARI